MLVLLVKKAPGIASVAFYNSDGDSRAGTNKAINTFFAPVKCLLFMLFKSGMNKAKAYIRDVSLGIWDTCPDWLYLPASCTLPSP
jgi:hypothetical protein